MKNDIDSHFAIAILALVGACVGFAFWLSNINDQVTTSVTPIASQSVQSSVSAKKDIRGYSFSFDRDEFDQIKDAEGKIEELERHVFKGDLNDIIQDKSQWKVYEDKSMGFSLQYPAVLEVKEFNTDDVPEQTRSAVGDQGRSKGIRMLLFSDIDYANVYPQFEEIAHFNFHSADYGRGYSEGCCGAYIGGPIDVGGDIQVQHRNSVERRFGIDEYPNIIKDQRKQIFGTTEGIRFITSYRYVSAWVYENTIIPLDGKPYSNLNISGPTLTMSPYFEEVPEGTDLGALAYEMYQRGEYISENTDLYQKLYDEILSTVKFK